MTKVGDYIKHTDIRGNELELKVINIIPERNIIQAVDKCGRLKDICQLNEKYTKINNMETNQSTQKCSNIIADVIHLENEVYDAALLAQKNLNSQLIYLNYINTIYKTNQFMFKETGNTVLKG